MNHTIDPSIIFQLLFELVQHLYYPQQRLTKVMFHFQSKAYQVTQEIQTAYLLL